MIHDQEHSLGESESPVLFLLGCERSGTTFVEEMFREHYDSADGNESHWVWKFFHLLDKKTIESKKEQQRHITAIFSDFYFANMANYYDVSFDYRDFIQEGPFDYTAFVHQVFRHIARTKQKAWVFNKTCSYCEHMDVVDQIFHTPKVVHLVRDGRDVALSLVRVKAWGPVSAYGAAKWWKNREDKIQDYAHTYMEGRFLEVKYEELIREPARVFEQMARFYGIFDEQRHSELARSVIKMRGNSEKWKTEMSHSSLKVFESVAGDTLERNGYELTSSIDSHAPLPVWRRFCFEVQEAIISRIKFHALLLRSVHVAHSIIGRLPRVKKRFYHSRFFKRFFNYHNLNEIFSHRK